MKISSKETKQIGSMCTVTEYPITGENNINFGKVELLGRYPEEGLVFNEICKELVYINEGKGKLVIEGKAFHVKAGNVILIEPKEKYFWEGQMTLFISCTPAWNANQHKLVEETFTHIETCSS